MYNESFLKGKVSLVTGATKGLGYGKAASLAEAGSDLVIVSRNQDDCDRVASELGQDGRKVLPVSADLRSLSSIDDLVNRATEQYGRIDVLVNNAGAAVTVPPEDITEKDWDYIMDLNLKGAFFTCQAVGRQMMKQGSGKIINIASIFGLVGDPNILSYCASKGGLIMLTKSLALARARHNIQVNAIAPAYIQTGMNKDILKKEKVHKYIMKNTPAQRMGNIEDLTGMILLLASPGSDYITGAAIAIDGGWTAH